VIEKPKQRKGFAAMDPAREDFLKDHSEAFNELDPAQQRKVLNVGSKIALMLKGSL